MEEGLGEAGKIPILGGGGGGIALSMLVIVVNDVVVVVFAAKVGDWIGSWRRERGHCRGRPSKSEVEVFIYGGGGGRVMEVGESRLRRALRGWDGSV